MSVHDGGDRPGPRGRPGRCARCLMRAELCLCPQVPVVPTRTRLLVVRHAIERFKPSNSARLAALALPALRLVDHGLFDEASRHAVEQALEEAEAAGAALLWPEGEPLSGARAGGDACSFLVVVDGSWSQARRMRQRLPALRRLRCVALAPAAVRTQRLRRAPDEGRLSTLEALACALAELEGDHVAAPLERLYDELCARCIPQPRRLPQAARELPPRRRPGS